MIITLFTALHGEVDIPLGLIYLAQLLIEYGHKVHVIDLNLYMNKSIDLSEFKQLKESDLIGFSSYRYTLSADVSIAWRVKSISDSIIVCGGWGPTLNPLLYLRYAPVDIVIPGVHMQAPKVLLSLARCIERGDDVSKIRGIIYKKGDMIIDNGLGEIPNSIPDINWQIIDKIGLELEKYLENGILVVPILGALASCPKYYSTPCIYCSIGRIIMEYRTVYANEFSNVIKKLMRFDASRIMRDIKGALVYFNEALGSKLKRISFTLVDDAVTPTNFIRFYDRLVDEGLIDDIGFIKFQTRPEYVPRIIKYIDQKHKNKFIIDVGFEFLSERDLSFTKRGNDSKIIMNVLKELRKSKVHWTGYVILATPISNASDVRSNIELALDIAYNSDLLRCNPYILEEDTSIPLEYGWEIIRWKTIKLLDKKGSQKVKIPYRPRFLVSKEEIKRIIRVIDEYLDRIDKLRNKAYEEAYSLVSERGELDLNDPINVVTRVYSLDELKRALLKLREALIEDYSAKGNVKLFKNISPSKPLSGEENEH